MTKDNGKDLTTNKNRKAKPLKMKVGQSPFHS